MNSQILIADIGGTNARFALCTPDSTEFFDQLTFSASDYQTLDDAIKAYLAEVGVCELRGMSLAVAGPIQNSSVQFLNSNWSVDQTSLVQDYNLEHAQLLNDWEALALSLPHICTDELLVLSSASDRHPIDLTDDGNYVAVGPGSGLGAAGLVVRNGASYPIVSEAGHIGFAAESAAQSAVLEAIRSRLGTRVSYERLLSGPGIENIYFSLCKLGDITPRFESAADISTAAKSNQDSIAAKSMNLFFELLGQFTGDLVLSLGAYDGAFIGGGICQRFPEALISSSFRRGFENKGRHKTLLQNTPTWLIQHQNPGLLGAAAWANNYFT